tara:strand:+ start:471 stop:650 length:180 start_codon:yes stop_codon:yes gene_type:complete
MLIFRWMIPTLFVVAGILFAMFIFTGDPRYKRIGIRVLIGTLLAAFAFFAVLIAINLLE